MRKDSRFLNALLKVMELAVEDITSGYVAIGGQTAIGRGFFARDEEETIYSEEISEKRMAEELRHIINGGGIHENG